MAARGTSLYSFICTELLFFSHSPTSSSSSAMASALCLRLPKFFCHGKSFELQGQKLRVNALPRSNNDEKGQEISGLSRSNLPRGALHALYFCSSQVPLTRWFLSGALSSAVSNQTNSESVPLVASVHSPQMVFNKVNCLLWVLHESARSFSLAIQAHELTRNQAELAMAWVGVDVQAWHKRIAYQVAVYALLKAVIEVELFLSHEHSTNPSPVNEMWVPIDLCRKSITGWSLVRGTVLSLRTNCLGESIESQLNIRHPKLVQWFRMVELPRIAGLFIPLFKKWSMEYAGSGVAGIILAISCCAAVKKLGSGRVSCPLLSASIEDILAHLMELSYSLVSVDKLHYLASEAGFEEDFLIHFGKKVLPGKNIEEVEFWIGLVQKKLSTAFHRENVISGKQIFCDKVQENSLAILGVFAYLGRETRLFLSRIGIKDLDENVKDFLSYLECGSLFVYPEFSSLSEYQLFMEVVTDEIEWLDFYASFPSILNQERRRSKQQANQAEKETILYTVLIVCYDIFSGFVHVSNSTQQPLDGRLLSFLLRSQSLLSICLEGYWAAHDKSGELLRISGRSVSDSSPSQIEGGTNPSANSEVNPQSIDLIKSGINQHRSQLIQDPNSAGLDPITLGKVGSAAESEPLHKSLLRKSTIKLISTTADMWMGTQLLCIDILDSLELLMKQLRGHKVTERERRKIQRTLADIASLIPITILMLLPVSAVGHAAMFAAIQKYMPFLVPTPYSSERLDVVKQLKRAKKMEVQSLYNIKDDASNL